MAEPLTTRETVPWTAFWPARPIHSMDDFAAFATEAGFCTWAPIPRVPFPNLAQVMGRTAASVLEPTWFWKDDLHIQHRLHYGKIVDGRPSFIAPDYLSSFVAALGGRGQERERDPDALYRDGRLSREALTIYTYLVDHPAQPSRDLRRGTHLQGRSADTAIERALVELQRRFLVCKVDITGRTRGTYSYVWDLAERFWPDQFEAAAGLSPTAARSHICARLQDFGLDPDPALLHRLFLWRK